MARHMIKSSLFVLEYRHIILGNFSKENSVSQPQLFAHFVFFAHLSSVILHQEWFHRINVEIKLWRKLSPAPPPPAPNPPPSPPHQNLHSLITHSLKGSPQSARRSDNQTSKPSTARKIIILSWLSWQIQNMPISQSSCKPERFQAICTTIAYSSPSPLAPT